MLFRRAAASAHDRAPEARVRVGVLTPEVVVRGTVAEGITVVTIPDGSGSIGSWSALELVDAVIAPLGDPAAAESLGRFHAHGDRIVAVLIEDGVGAAPLRAWERHREPAAGVFHLGPFLLHGTMRRLNAQVMDRVMPVSGARVESAPGGPLLDLRADLALVNTRWLYGFRPAPEG